jgi:catechol 2,3-dioxygenase-like lactoylglutathione lyase family enzyme
VLVKLDHCVIHVSDWDRSNTFYRDVLGAELISAGPRWAYRFGTEQLNVHGPGVEAEPVAKRPVPPGGSDLCFEWPGPITNAQEHLRRQGVEVEFGPVVRSGARARARASTSATPTARSSSSSRTPRRRGSRDRAQTFNENHAFVGMLVVSEDLAPD